MDALQEIFIRCPSCGERISVLVDVSAGDEEYVEDCEVCCRPMTITLSMGPGEDCVVEARSESDCS